MPIDIINMGENESIKEFAKTLGFTKIIFSINNLKILEESDEIKIRKALENKKFNILLNPHIAMQRDHLHFRRSGLNQVICKILKEKNISIAFSLDHMQTPTEIGRIKQDIKFCRKYKINIKVFTLAKNKYEMRNLNDLISFCKTLGMTGKEAKKAFE